VKIVLLDNQALGMVRQWQELFFAERYSEIDLSDNPDFAALAQAFGIEACMSTARDDVEAAPAGLLAARARRCCTSPSIPPPTSGRWCRRIATTRK
jgi:thiamine pyrophosphate-dependent acetolactate synthase large subunit-like protein